MAKQKWAEARSVYSTVRPCADYLLFTGVVNWFVHILARVDPAAKPEAVPLPRPKMLSEVVRAKMRAGFPSQRVPATLT